MGHLPAERSFEAISWIQAAAADLLVPSDALWKDRWDRASVKHSLVVSFVSLIDWVCHRGKQSTVLVEGCIFVRADGSGSDGFNGQPASTTRAGRPVLLILGCVANKRRAMYDYCLVANSPCGWLTGVPLNPTSGSRVKKIAVFADVQNIYYTTRQAYGRQFNYRKVWQRISAGGEIVAATAYAIDRGDRRQIGFQNTLKQLGFTVKLKPYIQRRDGSAKGDWDVGIAIDVIEMARAVDVAVLLSGDGDFDLLLAKIKQDYAVTTEVYGVPELTAQSLVDAACVYHPIKSELLM